MLQASTSPALQAALEPLRVLVPSPLGTLAVDLVGLAVSKLTIAPGAGQKKNSIPLGKMHTNDALDEIFGRLSEYFAGARKSPQIDFDLGPSGVDSFARRVLRETCRVPYGKTRSYQMIAEAAGRPEAYRSVLSILVANPIPILIPCHRVVTQRSGIGSYTAGVRRKKWLLNMEAQAARQASSNG